MHLFLMTFFLLLRYQLGQPRVQECCMDLPCGDIVVFKFQRINAINTQYQKQLTALRARHASRRDEFLLKESLVRQQQYQQAMMDHYPHSSMAPGDTMSTGNPHGYSGDAGSAAVGDGHGSYNSDNFDSYRERARFLGGARDQGFEPRGSYPGGRMYDTGSRYF